MNTTTAPSDEVIAEKAATLKRHFERFPDAYLAAHDEITALANGGGDLELAGQLYVGWEPEHFKDLLKKLDE